MRIEKLLFLLLILPLWIQAKPKKQKKMKFPFGTWMRSQEEDTDPNASWLLYRPGTYNFPPARGRSGFIVQKGGKFALLGPSPADRSDTVWGKWKQEAAGRLQIEVSGTALSQLSWKSAGKRRLLVELK
jgi:hypothetical protein